MSDMERIVRKHMTRMPEAVFEHSANTSVDREAVTHVCDECGVVEPIELFIGDTDRIGYMRRRCACEDRERERQYLEKLKQDYRVATIQIAASRTYTWLKIDQPELETMTFDNFDPEAQPPQYRMVITDAHNYTRGYATMCMAEVKGQPNLLMLGNFGTGKTHLACAVLNVLREHGVRCLFTTAQDFFDALYAAAFDEKANLLKQASDTPLLVIDDLDKLHVRLDTDGAFQKRTLFDILDRRYKGRRPTIITTNAQEDLSPWLDGATISRLSENLQPLMMNAVDFRRMKRARKPE